jgi:hypothetical protein
MSTTATWLKQKANGQWIRTDPPSKVAKTLLERVGRWKFSRVASIITCPTLRPDGSLLSEPGYDPTTQLLLVAPPPMPSIPERPTKTEAEAALNLLNELLVEFPFVNDIARAVGLSMLLTTVARGVMICAPGHVVTAPEAGTATTTGYGTETKYTYPELHDALMEAVGGERGTINGKALGWWFEKHKDRVVGEYKVVKTYDTHKKQQKWSLEKLQK